MDTTIRSNISMLNDITPQGDLHAGGKGNVENRRTTAAPHCPGYITPQGDLNLRNFKIS